jgi:hypothetical protein
VLRRVSKLTDVTRFEPSPPSFLSATPFNISRSPLWTYISRKEELLAIQVVLLVINLPFSHLKNTSDQATHNEEWRYNSIHSKPQCYIEIKVKLDVPVSLTQYSIMKRLIGAK